MTLSNDDIRALLGADVYDRTNRLVGTIAQVWADTTGQPAWVSVHTGLFGLKESLLPLIGAEFAGGRLHSPYDKAVIAKAPNLDVDVDHPLDSEGLRDLYAHYALVLDDSPSGSAANHPPAGPAHPGDDADGRTLIRSEERLDIRTETAAVEKVRLRKYVVTEYVTTTVPVRREELRVERVPVTDSDDVGDEMPSDAQISESAHEIVLHAERPVVSTETVPVERVRLLKDIVTEQQTVGGEVRKERIDVEPPDPPGR
jgi:uncharacterized protein (TIGR02271 family)